MNILYIDTRMGATSTKLLGALIDVMEKPDQFIYILNQIGIKGISVHRLDDALNGITGTRLEVRHVSATETDPYADEIDDDGKKHEHISHTHRTLADVIKIINSLSVDEDVKEQAIRVYENIADAISVSNGLDKRSMKLGGTGSRDIIVSIVGVCMAVKELNPEKIIVSTVSDGDGYTHTPRGRMPVPTPELQALLGDAPYTSGTERGELCTLCGAALISELADEYNNMPEMAIKKSGAGFGRRTFKSGVNCIRVYMGKALYTIANAEYVELTAQVYDKDKEAIIALSAKLGEMGIVSAHMLPIYDINGNDGFIIKVLVEDDKADDVATYILENANADRVMRALMKAYTK